MAKAENSEKSAVIGKPFEKGQTGNPSGRPKMPQHLKDLFRGKLSKLAVGVLEDILNGVDSTAKSSDRLKAAELVLDRSWGKAVQEVDATVDAKMRFISIGVPAFLESKPEGEDDN